MNDIEKLAEYFIKFPGIGRRQAKRFVYFLLKQDVNFRREISNTILKLGENTEQCGSCFRYFPKNGSSECAICKNIERDASKLLVLEKDSDLETVHSSGIYDGMYFILGGLIPITKKGGQEYIRTQKLISKIVEKIEAGELKEVILGLSVNPDGEHTRILLQNEIERATEGSVSVSILGRGLSTGTELEYSDTETLKNALETRTKK